MSEKPEERDQLRAAERLIVSAMRDAFEAEKLLQGVPAGTCAVAIGLLKEALWMVQEIKKRGAT